MFGFISLHGLNLPVYYTTKCIFFVEINNKFREKRRPDNEYERDRKCSLSTLCPHSVRLVALKWGNETEREIRELLTHSPSNHAPALFKHF